MQRKVIAFMLSLIVLLTLSACSGKGSSQKDDYSVTYSKSLTPDGAKLIYKLEYPKNVESEEKTLSLQVSNENGSSVQTLSVNSKLAFEDLDRILTLVDFNSDGFTDIVLLYADASGSNKIYNIWFWDNNQNQYVEGVKPTDCMFSNYQIVPEGKIVYSLVQNSAGSAEYRAYNFDEKFNPVLLRTASYEAQEDGTYKISVMDYADGAFLMYSSNDKELKNSFYLEMLVAGLDGKTLTASDSINLVKQSEQSISDIDCEGFVLKDETLYYCVRVDKSNATSAYYYVNCKTSEVLKVQGSSNLI